MIFKVLTFPKTTKIKPKTHQNEDAKKALQKPLQKSILGPILASQTLPKSKKKPIKTMLKKRHEKKGQKSAKKTHLGIHQPKIRVDLAPSPPSDSLPY